MAPANTGRDSKRRIAVKNTDQIKRGTVLQSIIDGRMLITVVIKFTAPKIEEIPAKCSLKIVKSTLPSGCPSLLAKGG